MIHVLFALLGLVVGGVINVLADDWPARERVQVPHCPRCDHRYVPAGYFALGRLLFHGGNCPDCGLPTRRRAIAVEIVTPILFALLPFFFTETVNLVFGALYVAILLLVIITDLEHRLILHKVTFPATALALAGSFFITGTDFLLALLGAVLGFVAFYIFFWIGQLVFGPGALGFGDVTLSMTLGAMLGFPAIVFTLVIGILLGGVVSIILLVLGKLTMRSRVAYGPFLAVAGIFMVLLGPQVMTWYLN